MTLFRDYDKASHFTMKYLRLEEVREQTNSHIYANNTPEHEARITVNYMY